jgi:hypothetical protein
MRMNLSMVSVALIALSGNVQAQDANPVFSYSGFGTLGYVITDTAGLTWSNGTQPKGATKTGSFDTETRMGFQVNGKFNDMLSGTVQVFAKQEGDGNYYPKAEWAFFKAKLGNSFSVRLGRIGAPFFMTSDYRAVGFTNLTVRTPPEVYAYVPVRNFDGMDVLYQGDLGGATVNAQLWGGNTRSFNSDDTYILLNNSVGLSVSAEMGSFTLRAGSMSTTLDAEGSGLNSLRTLMAGLNQLSAVPGLGSLKTIANDLSLTNKPATFSGLGLVFDNGQWVANAEYVMRTSDSLYVPTAKAWYTTVGYRINKFTPYVTLAARTQDSAKSVTAPSTVGYPAQVQGGVAQLIAGANNGVVPDTTGSSVSFGTRWDLGKSYALKGEWSSMSIPQGASSYLNRSMPGGRVASDTTVNAFTAVVDFVF